MAGGILLLTLFVRAPDFGDPFVDIDEQLYHLMGIKMLDGSIPYVDIWDRKPFGLFLIYAAGAAISQGTVIGYQILAALFCAWGAWLSFQIARDLANSRAGFWCAVCYIFSFPLFLSPGGQSEVFYLPLVLAMVRQLFRATESDGSNNSTCVKQLTIGAIYGGIALQIKYSALPMCIAFGLCASYLLYTQIGPKKTLLQSLLILLFFGLLPTGAVCIIYALTGHLETFWFANFSSIFLREELESGLMTRSFRDRVIVTALPFIAIALATGSLYALRKQFTLQHKMVLVFAFAGIVSYLMFGTKLVHYYLPAQVITILLLSNSFKNPLLGSILAATLLIHAIYFINFPSKIANAANHRALYKELDPLVAKYTDSRDNCLYVYDGPTSLYTMANTCLLTKFAFPDHLNNFAERSAIGADPASEVKEILRKRPGMIVTATPYFVPRINEKTQVLVEKEIADKYTLVSNPRLEPRQLYFYARNDLIHRQFE